MPILSAVVDGVTQVLGVVALGASLWMLFRARRRLRQTTLIGAWNWSAAGMILWGTAWTADVCFTVLPRGTADLLWYLTAVVMLWSPVAVLGAKRPNSRVWTAFVLFPLLLVLGWPAFVAWTAGSLHQPLEIETPALLCYGLVLLMGMGNYFGTRFVGSAVLLTVAMMFLMVPFYPLGLLRNAVPAAQHCRVLAALGLTAACGWATWQARGRSEGAVGLDRLWIDFRDWFGIVWAKRILDRVNQAARQEDWPARLELDGVVWKQNSLDADARRQTADRMEQTFRWLLRRFVDPEWIDERLRQDDACSRRSRSGLTNKAD